MKENFVEFIKNLKNDPNFISNFVEFIKEENEKNEKNKLFLLSDSFSVLEDEIYKLMIDNNLKSISDDTDIISKEVFNKFVDAALTMEQIYDEKSIFTTYYVETKKLKVLLIYGQGTITNIEIK